MCTCLDITNFIYLCFMIFYRFRQPFWRPFCFRPTWFPFCWRSARRKVHVSQNRRFFPENYTQFAKQPDYSLSPCSHEEADTRLLLHVAHAVQKGIRRVAIRTVDTDVVALAVASFSNINPDELWTALGTGSTFRRYIAVHQLAAAMNPRQRATLPIFHALTGCDMVSSFAGRGKKTA